MYSLNIMFLYEIKIGQFTEIWHLKYSTGHRRRIELEDKAKVVPSVWGQNPCRASCLACFAPQTVELSRSIWNKLLNSAGLFVINSWTQLFVSKRPRQNSSAAKQKCGKDYVPQSNATTCALSSYSILLLWYTQNFKHTNIVYIWQYSRYIIISFWWFTTTNHATSIISYNSRTSRGENGKWLY